MIIAMMLLFAALKLTHDPMPLPQFTFAGRVCDYAHVAYDADQKVEIRVYDGQGNLLAKGKTFTSGKTACNFSVDVPVADQPTAGCAVAGVTEVKIDFIDPDGQVFHGLVSQGDARVGAPGELKRLDIALGTDSDHDGVADEYVEALAYLMWKNKKSSYDAEADWDGDGANNRAEYVAGTNPFDPKDLFSVREMAEEKGYEGYLRFSFLANQGRSYSVDTTDDLKGPAWRQTVFVDAEDGVTKSHLNTSPTKAAAYRAIYVLKENIRQQFWKLKVE